MLAVNGETKEEIYSFVFFSRETLNSLGCKYTYVVGNSHAYECFFLLFYFPIGTNKFGG